MKKSNKATRKSSKPKQAVKGRKATSKGQTTRSLTLPITFREKFQSVVVNNGSYAGSWMINPGSQQLHPWLSIIASGFEYYNYSDLRIEWVPTCSKLTSGNVVIACDYDYNDPSPSVNDVGVWDGTVTEQVSNDAVFCANPKHLNIIPNRYIWTYNDVASEARLRFVGRLHLFVTADVPNGTTAGSFYVSYKITLSAPQKSSIASSELEAKTKKSGPTTGSPVPAACSEILSDTLKGLEL